MSYRPVRPDGLDSHIGKSRRSPSISSDVPSVSGRSMATPTPPLANPPPAYIGSTGASELVSSEMGETVSVSSSALALLNAFIDQTLYTILTTARSSNLARLKAAVPIVLKPRLGQAALKAADEELKEYFEDSDEEEVQPEHDSSRLDPDFDTELAWKLARLRCMVHTRLGDLEEEDEEDYLEQEQLVNHLEGSNRSIQLGSASAMFVTSVLEFLGEQALFYAAQHAQRRSHRNQWSETAQSPSKVEDGLVLEEADMFYVGRESPLSRLWRSWRRNIRSPREPSSRPMSPESFVSPTETSGIESRKNSIGAPISVIDEEPFQSQSLDQVLESQSPDQIPLPMSHNDVNEIEVPGLAREIYDGEEEAAPIPIPERSTRRPTSLVVPPSGLANGTSSAENAGQRPQVRHTRSNSVPVPRSLPLENFRGMETKEEHSPTLAESSEVVAGAAENEAVENEAKDKQMVDEELEHTPRRPITPDDDHARLGKVAAAVSAVAGALVAGSAAALRSSSQDKSITANQVQDSKSTRTVAEQMLGPSSGVAPPTDATIRASITSAGDFDNIHIPEGQERAEREAAATTHDEESDPEDLALSSAEDEPNEVHQATSQVLHKPDMVRPSSLVGTSLNHDTNEDLLAGPKSEDAQGDAKVNGLPQISERSEESLAAAQPNALHNQQGSKDSVASPRNLSPNGTEANLVSASSSAYQAVTIPRSPAAASKELAEQQRVAAAISENERMIAVSNNRPAAVVAAPVPGRVSSIERTQAGHTHGLSKSSQVSSHSKSSSSSSKLLGFTRDQQDRPQQVSVPNSIPSNSVNGTKMMQSSIETPQSVPASNSRGQTKRPQSKLLIPTEDGRKAGPRVDTPDEERKRNLEDLITSNETLHYTLTPASARAEHFPVPPSHTSTKSPNTESTGSKNGRLIVPAGIAALRASPIPFANSPTQKVVPSAQRVTPAPAASPKHKNFTARDPRVDRHTTRDLADYARSTGPESLNQLPKVLALPVASAAGHSGQMATTPSLSTDRPTAPSSNGSAGTLPKSTKARHKYEPRDAAPTRRGETAELIDFIREGPPRAAGDHRIDRNVAPFRRTMDSDDLNMYMIPPKENEQNGASSVTSTQNSVAGKSIQSSMNSRTALLDSSSKANIKGFTGYQITPIQDLRPSAGGENSGPKRTKRRVRDPYALDESDDEIEPEINRPKVKSQEESLIDFLRNTAPPPEMVSQPIMATDSREQAPPTVKKENSNPGLKDRLLRTASLTGLSRNANLSHSKSGTLQEEPPSYFRGSSTARAESPHLSQVGSKLDSYRPTNPTHASHVERNRKKSHDGGDLPSPRTTGQTPDFMEYLKNSTPPLGTRQEEMMKEDAGLMKFFSRKGSIRK